MKIFLKTFNISLIKKIIFGMLFLNIFLLSACTEKNNNELYVYNWGLYIDDVTIDKFQKETGIKVIYDMFDTNEEMYAKLKTNAIQYDVICPTDYMIEKMIKEDMLHEYKISDLENYKYLDEDCLNYMQSFDKNNSYAVPYVYSTLGIVYNKTLLDEKNLPYPTKWSDLFLEKYKGEIVLQDAVRDLIMVGLYKNNFSLNSTNDKELEIAEKDLINQKPLIYAYLIDPARDKIANGEASIASMYSGEMEFIKEEGKKLGYEYDYILPKEGANITFDCWCILKNSENKQNALKWIDFMTRPDIAKINYEYMHYGIPNKAVKEMISQDEVNDQTIFPDLKNGNYEIYKDLGEYNEKYTEMWKRIKSK